MRNASGGTRVCIAVLAVAAFQPTACQSDPISCPQWILSPIIVEVRDAATGEPAAQGASGWIIMGRDSARMLPATPTEQLELHAPGGPGIYDVVVQKAGFRNWTRDNVYVRGGNCGVERSVRLRADLERAP